MTATEELRRLLDERGVDYRVSATGYSIDIGPYTTAYANRSDTTLDVSLRQVTPEQAIAATLGSCNCSNNCTNSERTGTCHMVLREDIRGHAYQDIYECSECGEEIVRETYMGESEPPNYCPNCGRRIEVDDA